jgi:hypothetical protein
MFGLQIARRSAPGPAVTQSMATRSFCLCCCGGASFVWRSCDWLRFVDLMASIHRFMLNLKEQ